jgi:hypothetical protein
MISKSMRNALTKISGQKQTVGLVATQSRGMGGGKAKPNMPVTETDFDIVLVGK